jgi:hypothetical protein
MAIKTFSVGEVLTAADTNTYLGNSGLVYVKSQTVGNAVGTVTVSDAFSTTYDSYKIIYTGGNMSVSTALVCQIGAASTGYYGAFVYGQSNTTSVSAANDNNTAFFTYAGGNSDTVSTFASFDVLGPFTATQTQLVAPAVHYGVNFGSYNGVLIGTTSYTSFLLSPFSGTMTGGTITVYGYRKA